MENTAEVNITFSPSLPPSIPQTGMVLIAMAEMYEKVREMADAVHSMTVELGQSRREVWRD